MRVPLCRAALVVACLSFSLPLHAQTGLTADLAKDIGEVQDKIVGLAKALPAGAYDWRPAKDVRSTGEVLMHVAADNYFLPAAMGIPPRPRPASSARSTRPRPRSRRRR